MESLVPLYEYHHIISQQDNVKEHTELQNNVASGIMASQHLSAVETYFITV